MPTHNRFVTGPNGQLAPTGLVNIGAIFPIEVHVPPQIANVLTNQGHPIPPPITGAALIDTGATLTCIHEPLLQQLGLNPIGVINSGTANGPVQQSTYPARIMFPSVGWTLDLHSVVGVNLTGQSVTTNPPQNVIALLGRNFLERFVFIWNGPGGFWTISG